jgi:FkbM family methyltransferase
VSYSERRGYGAIGGYQLKKAAKALFTNALAALPSTARDKLCNLMLREASVEWRYRAGFPTMEGSLRSLRNNGFLPRLIVDVGAYHGDWSRLASGIFPDAEVRMFEAQKSKSAALEAAVEEIGSRSQYSICLLGADNGAEVVFFEQETGSSVFKEVSDIEACPVSHKTQRIDACLEAERAASPLLMKLDVQGYELEVLKGASALLPKIEVMLLEVARLEYNTSAPLMADVIAFMAERQFVPYDFCGALRRQSDDALFQTDILFVKSDSNLRMKKAFWLP